MSTPAAEDSARDAATSDSPVVHLRSEMDVHPSTSAGLIGDLIRSRHGTPFEHDSMTFHVRAPPFVFREFQHHRIASYDEESGRYREHEPVFTPAADRKQAQVTEDAGRRRRP